MAKPQGDTCKIAVIPETNYVKLELVISRGKVLALVSALKWEKNALTDDLLYLLDNARITAETQFPNKMGDFKLENIRPLQ